MSLREKVADIISARADVTGGRWDAADAILALPEITEALKAQNVVDNTAKLVVYDADDQFHEMGAAHLDDLRTAVITKPCEACDEGAVGLGEYVPGACATGGDRRALIQTDGMMGSAAQQCCSMKPEVDFGGGFGGWGREDTTASSYRGRMNRRRRARPSSK